MFRKSSYITLDRERERERATTTHLVDIRYSNRAKGITRKEAVTGMRAVVLRYDIRVFFYLLLHHSRFGRQTKH